MKINLLGYYGMNNIGDELMRANILTYFKTRDDIQRVNVFCRKAPEADSGFVKYFDLNRFSKITKAFQLMKNEQTFWGGGTCIYQADNSNGLFALRSMQKIVKTSGKKFGFLGIGIGKLNDKRYLDTARELLKNADQCYFRDDNSLDKAKELYPQGNYCLGGDLVFLSDIKEKSNRSENIKEISVSAHSLFHDYPPEFYSKMLNKLIKYYNCKINFLPAHAGDEYNDNIMHKKIAELLPKGKYSILNWDKEQEYISQIAEMDFHIGVRLHSLVIADLLGIPNFGISYSPKVESYIRKSGVQTELRLFNSEEIDVVKRIDRIIENYTRPDEFIKNERKVTLKCLDRIV